MTNLLFFPGSGSSSCDAVPGPFVSRPVAGLDWYDPVAERQLRHRLALLGRVAYHATSGAGRFRNQPEVAWRSSCRETDFWQSLRRIIWIGSTIALESSMDEPHSMPERYCMNEPIYG
jgi:hypothetical protein